MSQSFNRRLVLVASLAAVFVLVAVLVLSRQPAAAQSPTPTQPAERAAEALSQSPSRSSEPALTGTAVLSERDAQAAQVPVPAGGNFNGINWSATFSPNEIGRQLQANAACQWWRAAADGDAAAAKIARTIPSWPAFRANETDVLDEWAASITRALDDPQALREAISNCYLLQTQLTERAKAEGSVPSR